MARWLRTCAAWSAPGAWRGGGADGQQRPLAHDAQARARARARVRQAGRRRGGDRGLQLDVFGALWPRHSGVSRPGGRRRALHRAAHARADSLFSCSLWPFPSALLIRFWYDYAALQYHHRSTIGPMFRERGPATAPLQCQDRFIASAQCYCSTAPVLLDVPQHYYGSTTAGQLQDYLSALLQHLFDLHYYDDDSTISTPSTTVTTSTTSTYF